MKEKIVLIIGIIGFILFIILCMIFYKSYTNNMNLETELAEETINNIEESIENSNVVNEEVIVNNNTVDSIPQENEKTTENESEKKQQNTQVNKKSNAKQSITTQPNTQMEDTQSQVTTQTAEPQPATTQPIIQEAQQQIVENKPQEETTSTQIEQPVVKKKTLLYFGATWCGYCKIMEPHINEIASQMSSTVTVIKYDYDTNRDIAIQYNVTALPTTIILEDGIIINKLVGYRDKSVIVNALK